MPAKGPVSLTRQTIFCFIPILNWYAAYHIKKFRKYLLIVIIVELVLGGIHMGLIPEYDETKMFGENYPQSIDDVNVDWAEIIFRTDHPLGPSVFLLIVIVEFGITVFFIRRWSHQWNLQFT